MTERTTGGAARRETLSFGRNSTAHPDIVPPARSPSADKSPGH